MKKIMFSLAVLCSVALVSCGGKKADEKCDTACPDTTVAVVEEVAVAADSTPDSANVEAAAVEAAAETPAPAEAPAN